jgi:uncharacterized DUF497 family protein
MVRWNYGVDEDFEGCEWDEFKSEQNLADRGYDFDFASRIFDGMFIEHAQLRPNDDERRYVAVGEVDGFVIRVVWTPRGRKRRIISSRLAKSKEVTQYDGYRQTTKRQDED